MTAVATNDTHDCNGGADAEEGDGGNDAHDVARMTMMKTMTIAQLLMKCSVPAFTCQLSYIWRHRSEPLGPCRGGRIRACGMTRCSFQPWNREHLHAVGPLPELPLEGHQTHCTLKSHIGAMKIAIATVAADGSGSLPKNQIEHMLAAKKWHFH